MASTLTYYVHKKQKTTTTIIFHEKQVSKKSFMKSYKTTYLFVKKQISIPRSARAKLALKKDIDSGQTRVKFLGVFL